MCHKDGFSSSKEGYNNVSSKYNSEQATHAYNQFPYYPQAQLDKWCLSEKFLPNDEYPIALERQKLEYKEALDLARFFYPEYSVKPHEEAKGYFQLIKIGEPIIIVEEVKVIPITEIEQSNVITPNVEEIYSISITKRVYDWLNDYMMKEELTSSTFNHGKGVDRRMTLHFTLQSSEFKDRTYYKVTKGGRPPSQYNSYNKPEHRARLARTTPSFDTIVKSCLKVYPKDVYKQMKRKLYK